MKVFTTILKIVAALAAIAGVIYVIATYGDKLTAWAKKMLDKFNCCCFCNCGCDCDCDCCDEIAEEEVSEIGDQDFAE